jgi:hypothetical protein
VPAAEILARVREPGALEERSLEAAAVSAPAATAGATGGAAAERAPGEALLASTDLPSLLDQMAAAAGAPRQVRLPLRTRLEAWVRQDGSAPRLLVERLRAGRPLPEDAFLALALAGTAPAQAALVAIATDAGQGHETRRAALASLRRILEVTGETATALAGLLGETSPELRYHAAHVVGAAVRALGAHDPVLAGKLLSTLLSRAQAGAAADRLVFVSALGNCADARVMPVLEAALRSEDPAMRAMAAKSLRLVPGPAPDARLGRVMIEDATAQVRASAVFAASFRDVRTFLPALDQLLRREASVPVKKEAVDFLGQHLDASPQVAAVLQIALGDGSASVRELAQRYLARQRAEAPRPGAAGPLRDPALPHAGRRLVKMASMGGLR